MAHFCAAPVVAISTVFPLLLLGFVFYDLFRSFLVILLTLYNRIHRLFVALVFAQGSGSRHRPCLPNCKYLVLCGPHVSDWERM